MFEQLADVFTSAAFKYLTAVDASPVSNQHEIGGLVNAGIGEDLGTPDDGSQIKIAATLVYLSEEEGEPVIVEDTVTWYDTRYQDPTRSPEWRLYYKSNDVSNRFEPGDFFMIAATHEGTLLMIFCPPGSEYEEQIRTLFGVRDTETNKRGLTGVQVGRPGFALPVRLMFARYGIEIGSDGTDYLELILDRFGATFPKTKDFSKFARDLTREISPVDTPDTALIEWMETEESAFRQLEKHIVQQRLREGFGENGDDVDEFVRFSLSVQNRRKSRSGHAFENHIETILLANGIQFDRGAKTEGRQKPDFLFPDSKSYSDTSFPGDKLRILGAKTTCKDRWRQVLAEAKRIPRKHLITMEPAISEAQTQQMEELQLQLVVPEAIQASYQPAQAEWLMSFRDFIDEIQSIQR
ncbi:type II restriction endonuclease [Photobacterium sp. TY1-4]|uniref:type II restriction endonuclease n=1 Tax=Photobacterium sp. TY1-4 TaxID=2899122 RepID=UPI0021C0C915|nr:type II restriction endonuclease [Photobacterium sp. TY1-4]UXI04732.1 type II restriction endonuclease [Photobacterium sp. TY1-4]